jgi:hypothetical protein
MLCHVSTDSGVFLSEIVLTGQNRTISAHWNEFTQNRWFFAISSNTGGSKYFTPKCDGFFGIATDRDPMLTLQGFGLQLDSAIETLAQSSHGLDLARGGAVCFHIGVRLQVVPRP